MMLQAQKLVNGEWRLANGQSKILPDPYRGDNHIYDYGALPDRSLLLISILLQRQEVTYRYKSLYFIHQ